jgi:preprotein translocase subunit YajC
MTFNALFPLVSQAAPGAAGPVQQPNFLTALVPFALVFVIFYLLIIMPQRKKQKKHLEMVDNLKPGSRIITTGGIYGTIMGVQKDKVELKISANVKIDITKSSIGVILAAESAPEKTE